MNEPNLDLAIRIWLARYLRGDIELDAFREWFSPATWDVRLKEPRAAELAYTIAALMVQLYGGEISEQQFRRATAHHATFATKLELPRLPRPEWDVEKLRGALA